MFFIVGTGRCGSMTIARTLSQHPKGDCGHHMGSVHTLKEMTQYCYDPTNEENLATLRANLKHIYSLPSKRGVKVGDSDLGLSLVIPVLKEQFPKSRFVWLIRDGRDVVTSMFSRGWYAGTDIAKEKGIPTFWEQNRLQGDLLGDFTSEQWEALDRFEKCCWLWSKFNLLIQDSLATVPAGRVLFFRFDKFKPKLRKLCLFVGLKRKIRFKVEQHNRSKYDLLPWEYWDDDQRKKFEVHCGTEMTRWFPEWKDSDSNWVRLTDHF